MGNFAIPLLIFVLAGGAASVWLLKVREPREQRSTGLMALSAMHWRELQRLVVAAMQARGYRPQTTVDATDDEGLVALQREDASWLLSTKHGTAYVLGNAAVSEFANTMRLQGAHGGVMATVGAVAADTRSLARTQRIEVLDGPGLWAEVSPLLEPGQRDVILAGVHERTRRHTAIAWAAALAAAALAFVALPAGDAEDAQPAPVAQSPRAAQSAQTGVASTTGDAAMPAVPEDPAALAERRRKLTLAIGTLPWVEHAAWSTPSTLIIDMRGGAAADKASLCKLVESYPELRASRLQLQAPKDSGQPVRFMQCRVY